MSALEKAFKLGWAARKREKKGEDGVEQSKLVGFFFSWKSLFHR